MPLRNSLRLSHAAMLAMAAWFFCASPLAAERAPQRLLPTRGADRGVLRLVFGGDVMIDRAVAKSLRQHGPAWAFEKVRPLWESADLVIANLESPVGEGGLPYTSKPVLLRGRPQDLDALALGGIGLVSLANNHILDWGPGVAARTVAELDERGIAHAGLIQEGKPQVPAIVRIKGWNIAFLSYCSVCPQEFIAHGSLPGAAVALKSGMARDVVAARRQADIVVVLVHWGQEYQEANALQKRLAKSLAEAGADLVMGAHSHVLQHVERIGGTLVAYGLGDLLFDLRRPATHPSALLWVDFERGKPPVHGHIPLDLSSFRPEPVAPDSPQGRWVERALKKPFPFRGRWELGSDPYWESER